MNNEHYNSRSTQAATANGQPNPQALGKFLLDEPLLSDVADCHQQEAPDENLFRPAVQVRKVSSVPGDSIQQRVSVVRRSKNPLLEAAQPLLRALRDLPESIANTQYVAILKQYLINEINAFTVVCDEIGISWQKMTIVRYCICTALDESAHAKSWGIAAAWSQSNLLNHFEGDNDGGNKFFLLIGRLSMNPEEYGDVLEILLRILGLGFEGRYSIDPDGERQLTKIRRRLLNILQNNSDSLPPALSPHPQAPGEKRTRFYIGLPLSMTLMVSLLSLTAAFIIYQYRLSSHLYELTSHIQALQQMNFTLPVKSAPEKLRLSVLLKPEIEKRQVQVFETTGESKIIFTGDVMFHSGSESVKPEIKATLQRIAQEVLRVNGSVLITGHTDAIPIHMAKYANNQILSEKRAVNVAEWFKRAGIDAEKITTKGAGDTHPISDNKTAQGRAKNRRVEIYVTY